MVANDYPRNLKFPKHKFQRQDNYWNFVVGDGKHWCHSLVSLDFEGKHCSSKIRVSRDLKTPQTGLLLC